MLFKKEPVRIAFSVVESFDENSYESDNKIYQCNRDINSKFVCSGVLKIPTRGHFPPKLF